MVCSVSIRHNIQHEHGNRQTKVALLVRERFVRCQSIRQHPLAPKHVIIWCMCALSDDTSKSSIVLNVPQDKSNGYEEFAEAFMSARNPRIGPAIIREWSKTLPRGCAILDLGCGYGVPLSKALIAEGFGVYGVDASAKMIAAFRSRFPEAHAQCGKRGEL